MVFDFWKILIYIYIYIYICFFQYVGLVLLQELCWSFFLGGLWERELFSWSSSHLDCFWSLVNAGTYLPMNCKVFSYCLIVVLVWAHGGIGVLVPKSVCFLYAFVVIAYLKDYSRPCSPNDGLTCLFVFCFFFPDSVYGFLLML